MRKVMPMGRGQLKKTRKKEGGFNRNGFFERKIKAVQSELEKRRGPIFLPDKPRNFSRYYMHFRSCLVSRGDL